MHERPSKLSRSQYSALPNIAHELDPLPHPDEEWTVGETDLSISTLRTLSNVDLIEKVGETKLDNPRRYGVTVWRTKPKLWNWLAERGHVDDD